MRIISTNTLRDFWQRPAHQDAEQPLRTWIKVVRAANWTSPPDVQKTFNTADVLKGGRYVFDIGGNRYRIVAKINYGYGIVFIRFVGTHKQYDQIDANEV